MIKLEVGGVIAVQDFLKKMFRDGFKVGTSLGAIVIGKVVEEQPKIGEEEVLEDSRDHPPKCYGSVTKTKLYLFVELSAPWDDKGLLLLVKWVIVNLVVVVA